MNFTGFQEYDFQDGVTGTHWRGDLGKEFAEQLSARTSTRFYHYPTYNWPQLLFYTQEPYRKYQAKLGIWLNREGVEFGFDIERGLVSDYNSDAAAEDIMDATWDWHRFINAIECEAELQQTLCETIVRFELSVQCEFGNSGKVKLMRQDLKSTEAWQALALWLKAAPPNWWLDFFLAKFISKENAISQKSHVIDDIAEIFVALKPLYDASTL